MTARIEAADAAEQRKRAAEAQVDALDAAIAAKRAELDGLAVAVKVEP